MRRSLLVTALLAIGLTGCYRITVNTGAPAAQNQIERKWQMSFAAGLVPPPVIDAQSECLEGVARVVTERSFLNVLATGVTSNIISPMQVVVTCAAGPVR